MRAAGADVSVSEETPCKGNKTLQRDPRTMEYQIKKGNVTSAIRA